jgi:putative transposase
VTDSRSVSTPALIKPDVRISPIRMLGYCLMRKHFHMILWPRREGELTAFMRWLTNTHTMRWHVAHNTVGRGHLYQGRFKSFIIQPQEYLLTALRYVERNPVRPGVVSRAEDWRWGSLWRREHGSDEQRQLLCDWPVARRADWVEWVNQPATAKEMEAWRRSIEKSCPFGETAWRLRIARRLGLEYTLREPGRPAAAKEEQ